MFYIFLTLLYVIGSTSEEFKEVKMGDEIIAVNLFQEDTFKKFHFNYHEDNFPTFHKKISDQSVCQFYEFPWEAQTNSENRLFSQSFEGYWELTNEKNLSLYPVHMFSKIPLTASVHGEECNFGGLFYDTMCYNFPNGATAFNYKKRAILDARGL